MLARAVAGAAAVVPPRLTGLMMSPNTANTLTITPPISERRRRSPNLNLPGLLHAFVDQLARDVDPFPAERLRLLGLQLVVVGKEVLDLGA